MLKRGSSTKNEVDEVVAIRVQPDTGSEWQMNMGCEELTDMICKAIDDNLPAAVTFRRRDYEQDAMMRELCLRNGLEVQEPSQEVAADSTQPLRVGVICNRACEAAAAIRTALSACLKGKFVLVDEEADTPAERVLLLLTAGVLQGDSLRALNATLAFDAQSKRDRIVALYHPESWDFRCDEKQAAPPNIQACLNGHEAITFRPQTEGANRHEFDAMARQLASQLRAELGLKWG